MADRWWVFSHLWIFYMHDIIAVCKKKKNAAFFLGLVTVDAVYWLGPPSRLGSPLLTPLVSVLNSSSLVAGLPRATWRWSPRPMSLLLLSIGVSLSDLTMSLLNSATRAFHRYGPLHARTHHLEDMQELEQSDCMVPPSHFPLKLVLLSWSFFDWAAL